MGWLVVVVLLTLLVRRVVVNCPKYGVEDSRGESAKSDRRGWNLRCPVGYKRGAMRDRQWRARVVEKRSGAFA